ncbi:MOSC domain-containing protein [Streptomyces atratus]|uniref:MOSC domain-containing protein n=1 Tax=Streptomyces atratus TaxID=1893 RepID=UPI0033E50270
MATLIAVNVGMPKDVAWHGNIIRTGVWKQPVAGPLMARSLNLDGDGQGELAGHGGEQRAVLVYQLDSYRHWQEHMKRDDFTYGQFGENFTVDGLADDEVCIGDRYQIGGAVFEVTQPRVTCYRVGLRMGEPQMAALLVSHRRPGFYMRVLAEGQVQAGDEIVRIAPGPEEMTVAEMDGLLYLPGHSRPQLERALRIPALSPGWKTSLRALLDDVDRGPGTVGGNSGGPGHSVRSRRGALTAPGVVAVRGPRRREPPLRRRSARAALPAARRPVIRLLQPSAQR